MVSRSKVGLLCAVARAIIDSGYAVPYRPPRAYMRRCQREMQLRDLSRQFEAKHGRKPRRAELARMSGLSKSSVTRILGPRRKGSKIAT